MEPDLKEIGSHWKQVRPVELDTVTVVQMGYVFITLIKTIANANFTFFAKLQTEYMRRYYI